MSNSSSNYKPDPIGVKGSWVVYGPITQADYKQIDKRGIWNDVVSFIDDKFPYTGNIMTIKVVIHNDHSRSSLGHCHYRPVDCDFDVTSSSDEDDFEFGPRDDEDDGTFESSSKKQKRITDFFGK